MIDALFLIVVAILGVYTAGQIDLSYLEKEAAEYWQKERSFDSYPKGHKKQLFANFKKHSKQIIQNRYDMLTSWHGQSNQNNRSLYVSGLL